MSSSAIDVQYGIVPGPGWTVSTLGQLTENSGSFIQTGPFGSQLHARDYRDEGVPVVMPQQLGDNTISTDGIARISETDWARLQRHAMEPGDIVFSRRGDVTRRAYIDEEHAGWLCGTGCLLIRLRHEDCDNQFLAYFFSLPQFKEYIKQKAVGATMPNLNQGILSAIPLVMPPRPTQESIVGTLASYDDLIENNTRRIKLLEDAARLLYEEWFVRLRFPGHEHTPVINGVPEGWERVPTTDAIHINPKTKLSDANEHWWVEMGNLPLNSMVIQSARLRQGRSGSKFQNGDTLFARITPCLENGKTAFVDFLDDGQVARGSTEFIVLRSKRLTPEYVYCLARTYAFRHNAIKSMIGASGRQRVQETCFDKHLILVPPTPLLNAFTNTAQPIFRQIRTLHLSSRRAREARDLLLPRLMSGEVVV
jgi:type I restriction enzyme S subunit